MAKAAETGRFTSAVLAALLLLTSVAVFTPLAPLQPGIGLDPSWELAMNQALAQGMTFGRDIIFTFGPYASLYTRMFHPATDHLMVWGGLYLGLSFFLAAYLNMRHASWPLQIALALGLASVAVMRDALFFLYPLLVGASILGAPLRRKALSSPLLLAVLAAPLGLLPLIKQSMLAASLSVILFSSVVLAERRRMDLLATLLIVPPLAMMLFWRLAGQPVAALADYYRSASDIISGYPEAMSLPGNPFEIAAFGITCMLVARTVFTGLDANRRLTRAAGTLMFLALLFLAFKAGFIRHDQHAVIAGSFLLLCSLVAVALYATAPLPPLLICAALVFAMTVRDVPGGAGVVPRQVEETYAGLWTGTQMRLLWPGQLERDFDDHLAAIRQATGTPTVEGSSDIYAYDQAGLIAAGNQWNPRPVLQSYSAYTPALAEADREHLLGSGAPDRIIFRVETIDGRLPSLEDGPSWRVLLSHYAPEAIMSNSLVLRRKTDARAGTWPSLLPPVSSQHRMGETVLLGEGQGPLFARLHLRPSLFGRLWSILFKPTAIGITLVTAKGDTREFRLIPGMAQSEFLLSPLIETTAEFEQLYGRNGGLHDKDIRSIAIDERGWPGGWATDYTLELLPSSAVAAGTP